MCANRAQNALIKSMSNVGNQKYIPRRTFNKSIFSSRCQVPSCQRPSFSDYDILNYFAYLLWSHFPVPNSKCTAPVTQTHASLRAVWACHWCQSAWVRTLVHKITVNQSDSALDPTLPTVLALGLWCLVWQTHCFASVHPCTPLVVVPVFHCLQEIDPWLGSYVLAGHGKRRSGPAHDL